jgi:hypothetical protein
VRGADLGAHGFQLALDEALTLRGRVAAKDHIGAAIDKEPGLLFTWHAVRAVIMG